MKVPLFCPQCMILHNVKPISFGEYTDNNRYEIICPRGHKGVVVLQQQKFEVLFEIGAYAINDGYYREAVSSFTSSLERFYAFFIQAFLYEHGLDAEIFDAAWKHISNQSERQLGGYVVAYTYAFSRPPVLLDRKKVEFRNSVIHKGKIPTRAEAVEYGEAVLALLRRAIREVSDRFPQGVKRIVDEHIAAGRAETEIFNSVTTSLVTIVSLSVVDARHNSSTLEVALENIRQGKQTLTL